MNETNTSVYHTNDKFVVDHEEFGPQPVLVSNLEPHRRISTELPQLQLDGEITSDADLATPKEVVHHPAPKSRRKKRWIAMILLVAVAVILAAVLGGILGSRAASQAGSQPQDTAPQNNTLPVNPDSVDAGFPAQYVRIGSPLVVVPGNAWTPWESIDPLNTQTVFYQTAKGNMAMSGRNQAGWTTDSTLLTDQMNGTGITAVTYQNGSNFQYSMFYDGSSTTSIREKRQMNGTNYWVLGPLSFFFNNVTVNGTGETRWQSLSLSGVYSENFSTGPGTRLFYHRKNASTAWIQELVWYQRNDSWMMGSRIPEVADDVHISVVIEESSKSLCLFYGNNGSVSEVWRNISDPRSNYQSGLSLPILSHNSAGFTAVAGQNTTYIYYAVNGTTDSTMAIMEMEIQQRGSSNNTFTTSLNTVAISNLTSQAVSANGLGQFISVGAAAYGGVVTVVYPEHGYGALTAVTKNEGAAWNSSSVRTENIPLNSNVGT